MTPAARFGSHFLLAMIASMIPVGCSSRSEAQPARTQGTASAPAHPTHAHIHPVAPEPSLGVADKGIWSELDADVQVPLPADLGPHRVTAAIDRERDLIVLAIDGFPAKIYPLGGPAILTVGGHTLALRAGDRGELAPLLAAGRVTVARAKRDADRDGIPDPLDVLLGAKKTALNAADYTEGYVRLAYPMGDVPRTIGVCTDVIVRAVRNAGVDLQRAVHEDIRRAPRAYPMVKGKGNPHIDHRRVKTILPYFKRHWEQHTARLDDPDDPLRPGDVIFMDTFPSRAGPDHIGILSDRVNELGQPLVINNWTTGTKTAEMDLLSFVPVLYRFRLPPS